ncbi:hypothetical protein [Paludisphaera rhizosphaerae]|uniref:hypothetical protein n=1 Tax=Paludisphaera rhizosphaerae TaxID=2711216 RepID=UPI0013EDC62A|nr:hypothetical protein [Paludisphaera rhizosphaerae]
MTPRIAAWTLAAMILLAARPAAACPTCKEALSAQPTDASRLADGFNKSILLMLAVPIGLASIGGFAVHRAVKRGLLPEF